MDLKTARAMRGAGDYHRALKLYRCAPPHQRPIAERESYDCMLELASCRRVIDDLMAGLGWRRDRYGGFGHLEARAIHHADTAGLCGAFVALRRVDGARALARAVIASELVGPQTPGRDAADRLAELGIAVRGGVRLAVAQAQMRAGRYDDALANLRVVVVEAPSQMLGWHALAVMLLKRGRRAEAMVPAHLATQLPRNRPNVYAGSSEPVLRYRGHAVFFSNGGFVAYPAAPRRPAYLDRQSGVASDPAAPSWRARYQAFWRRVARARVTERLRRPFRRRIHTVESVDLTDLLAMLDESATELMQRRAARRAWPLFRRDPAAAR
jgi:hypothetical protein